MSQDGISKSFVDSAAKSSFSIHNLPYGIFTTSDSDSARTGVAIGDKVVDLASLESQGLLPKATHALHSTGSLNAFASQASSFWRQTRASLQELLGENSPSKDAVSKALLDASDVHMHMPFEVGSFTDFYACENHASNVGRLFRKGQPPLMPNWKHLPVAYHGRATTVFVDGAPVVRPSGLVMKPGEEAPEFSASKKMDYELELGIFVGTGNPDGEPIPAKDALDHIFGFVLLNDWSARDIQAFEYKPLGPFLGKSFATSISPWVVTPDALKPCMEKHVVDGPKQASYLSSGPLLMPQIDFSVELETQDGGHKEICKANSKELYWTPDQMLAHHSINGCVMQTGDLLGTGTISGKVEGSLGSLLETTLNGSEPIEMSDGSKRTFLQDGDHLTISGHADCGDYVVGFGEVGATLLPARNFS